MDFKFVQKKAMENTMRYAKKFNVKIDKDWAMFKLYEEVGEFVQAVLIHNKRSRPEKFVDVDVSKEMISRELADIVGVCMVNAELLDIDLEKALYDKWLHKVMDKK